MTSNKMFIATGLVGLAFAAHSAQAIVIYSDDFDGAGGLLDTTTPDVSATGESWVAAPSFQDDGVMVTDTVPTAFNSSGSATLAFTPVDGRVYTLEASIENIIGDTDWFAVGFSSGQSNASSSNSRFITGNVEGLGWALYRGAQTGDPVTTNMTWLGDTAVEPNSGLASGASPWLAGASAAGGAVDFRMTLDTTGGTGTWTVLMEADLGSGFETIRATEALLDESITSVGIANSRTTDVLGTLTAFSLSDDSTALTPGDTDGDGDIDDSDLGTSFANYTGPVGAAGNKTAAQGDTDGDGDVDDSDLGTSFAGYTGPQGPAAVPEPTSLALLGLGGLLVARRRRA